MRIKRIAGLALAGAAAVAAVGFAGAAYADDPADSEKTVRIVTENNGNVFGGTVDVPKDCPEKNGGAATPAEAGL
ncbi:hypothetical protein C6361_05590 [Plantactinospora sp. BC1]|uniref:hypothetical protein n=1 Tax=Plantactinospora sp. BC1 TaxID=2108470 RepID=UPI000D169577|nr:hypothetical protein [Plantactinospora sp. BC1]AVT29052.1 hypothetical protein C6361_05590 [Plantactinospora sp. BC1]